MGSIKWVPFRNDICKGDQILRTSIKKKKRKRYKFT